MPHQRPKHPLLRPRLLLALAATLLSACATPRTPSPKPNVRLAPAPYYDTRTGIYFPGSLETLYRLPIVDLEGKTPGLGTAISYRDPAAKIDIFVYDLQASVIPNGIEAPIVTQSFDAAIDDIAKAAAKGIYTNYQLLERDVVSIGPYDFLHARVSYGENLLLRDAHLFVAGVNGQILKIRAAMNQPATLDLARALGYVADAIARSQRNGYGGLDPQQIDAIDDELARIDLSDGIQPREAIAIAQIELIRRRLHHRFDAANAAVGQRDGAIEVTFQAYPSTPPRVIPSFVTFAIDENAHAQLVADSD